MKQENSKKHSKARIYICIQNYSNIDAISQIAKSAETWRFF